MSVTVNTLVQTYPATVTIPGDFSDEQSTDFQVALGSYDTPGAFSTPDSVTINGSTNAVLMARLGNGLNFDPIAGDYWLWGRDSNSPDLTLVRSTQLLHVVTTLGHDIPNALSFVQTADFTTALAGKAAAADLTSEATARADGDTAVLAQVAGEYVARPVSGDATGSVPTKQSDGSIVYQVPDVVAAAVDLGGAFEITVTA